MHNNLQHVGVKGMKWGRTKGAISNTFKKAPKGIERAKQKVKRVIEDAKINSNERSRNKTLSSPSELYKKRKKFTEAEIKTAMTRMKMERDLRNLSKDELLAGSQYATALLANVTAYITVGSAVIKGASMVAKKLKK